MPDLLQALIHNPCVPDDLKERLVLVSDSSRPMGTHVVATKGVGKSRLMGVGFAWQDFRRGIPTVILDPNGPTIDYFIWKLLCQPEEVQRLIWKRVIYVDMSGKGGHIVPFPLYYRLADESLFEI